MYDKMAVTKGCITVQEAMQATVTILISSYAEAAIERASKQRLNVGRRHTIGLLC